MNRSVRLRSPACLGWLIGLLSVPLVCSLARPAPVRAQSPPLHDPARRPVELGSADPALERAILRSVPGYRPQLVGEDPARWARYARAAADLNGDGSDEVLVYLMGSIFCGTGGCSLQIYRSSAEGYVLVSDLPTSRLPVVVADSGSNGWKDLWILKSGGGMPATYVRLVFNGEAYGEGERIAAAQGQPPGSALFSPTPSFQDGLPLPPSR
ncbi:MAG: hypothetical protein AAFX65_12520 [Cyanobacteria bacterium J06638_7]